MKTQIQKFTLATTILLLSLVTVKTSPANASVLFTGKYASLEKIMKLIFLVQREQILANLSQGNESLISAIETDAKLPKNPEMLNDNKKSNKQTKITLKLV